MNKSKIIKSSIFYDYCGTDDLLMQGTGFIDKYRKFLNKKTFRVADTDLSYRQINSLDGNKIIKDTRKNKKNWRKFSFKELIFFLIIKELRQYGIKDEQLKSLRNVFFGSDNSLHTDFSLIKIFGGIKIFLVFDGEANVTFHDIVFFDLMGGDNYKSFININLNEIVMGLWVKIGKKRIKYKNNFDLTDVYSPKEQEIIKIIRNKEYRNITVKKSVGKGFIIKAERSAEFKEKDLMEAIKKKDFMEIKVVKRNGNIVNIKVEDTYKV